MVWEKITLFNEIVAVDSGAESKTVNLLLRVEKSTSIFLSVIEFSQLRTEIISLSALFLLVCSEESSSF